MTALKLEKVSIRYKIGDFREIGLKEYVMRHPGGSLGKLRENEK